MTLLGIDISHYQGTPDFPRLKSQGVAFSIAKATQGTTFRDATFASNRAGARNEGIIPGAYHFAGGGDPDSESKFFCDTVGTLVSGELVALDYEIHLTNPVQWCLQWLRATEARLGVKPLIYLNQSTVNGFDWSPVVAENYGLWLAKYDFNQAVVATKYWGGEAIKQYSDKGTLLGINGTEDLDVFYGDLAALVKYGKNGGVVSTPTPAPAPAPVPAPAGFDVRAWRAHLGAQGAVFRNLQAWACRNYPAYAHISPLAPIYGPQTAAFLKEFCKRQGVSSDGNDIGPKTAQLLYNAGFRG